MTRPGLRFVALVVALSACSSGGQAPGSSGPPDDEPSGGGGSGGSTGGAPAHLDAGVTSPDAAPPADSGPEPDVAVVSSDAAAPDSASGPTAAFTCNLLVGPSPMMQWFDGGFLQQPGIDASRWELIWVAHHYTDAWARPGDSAWSTPFEKGHACATNANAPDRVIFQATQWSYSTAAPWITDLTGIVNNIKTKWPSVKRIELMASTTAPGDQPCPAAGGKNNETIVPAFAFEAIEAMPAKFPGVVFALPHFEVPCADFIGNGTAPQYAPNAAATTGAAVMDVAKIFGAYFAAHP